MFNGQRDGQFNFCLQIPNRKDIPVFFFFFFFFEQKKWVWLSKDLAIGEEALGRTEVQRRLL